MGKNRNQKGFTIIELMIATTVFSFILLVASVAVISIGRTYYKALISTRTQEAARRVAEDVGSSLQFSGSGISRGGGDDLYSLKSICFGQDRYTYKINSKVPGGSGLVHDLRPDLGDCSPLAAGGEQLLSDNMRLLQFDIGNSNPYSIKITVGSGDNDLFDVLYPPNASDTTPPNSGVDPSRAVCRASIFGGTFCAVSGLETVVTKRVE